MTLEAVEADRYFSASNASERATEAAMVAMAEGVRGDLGQVTKAHAGLYRLLQEQGIEIAHVSEELKRARLAIEQHDHRLLAMESQIASVGLWVKAGITLLTGLGIAVLVLLIQLTHAH